MTRKTLHLSSNSRLFIQTPITPSTIHLPTIYGSVSTMLETPREKPQQKAIAAPPCVSVSFFKPVYPLFMKSLSCLEQDWTSPIRLNRPFNRKLHSKLPQFIREGLISERDSAHFQPKFLS
ncbi:hypothetical protein N7505_009049 [Penicillium chrysogenum]|uniref:Uncharacterized protein n=1 Tax=Penicillium chrysogenum TaxID=5076 RepID=A0ABQ8W9R1_PENCH|nr:hypothetical protein N7505_009049 [Penicillium chrysogenum]